MYVEVFAKSDDDKASRGKTTWLSTGNWPLSIALLKSAPRDRRGSPERVEIKASNQRELGTGNRGGGPRTTNYDLTIQLTSTELAALVSFALRNKLIDVVSVDRGRKSK